MLKYIKDMMPESLKSLCDIKIGLLPKKYVNNIIPYNDEEYNIEELRFFISDDRHIVIYSDKFDMPIEVIQRLFIDIFGEIDLMANDFSFDIADR